MKTPGQILYEAETSNDPVVHCNRFPLWSELSEASRKEYERRAAPTRPPMTKCVLSEDRVRHLALTAKKRLRDDAAVLFGAGDAKKSMDILALALADAANEGAEAQRKEVEHLNAQLAVYDKIIEGIDPKLVREP